MYYLESAALLGSKETVFFFKKPNKLPSFFTPISGAGTAHLLVHPSLLTCIAELWRCSCLSLLRHSSSMELAFLCLHRAFEQRQNTNYLVPAVNHKQVTASLQARASVTTVTSNLPTVPHSKGRYPHPTAMC